MQRIKHERLLCSLWLRFKFRRLVKAARQAELAEEIRFDIAMSRELAKNRMVFDPEDDNGG